MIRKTWFPCLVNGSITIYYMLHFNRWASTDISFVVAQELTSSILVLDMYSSMLLPISTHCASRVQCASCD